MFCPKCGKTEGRFIGSFCTECHLSDHPLAHFKGKPFIERCPTCTNMKVRHKWKPYSLHDLGTAIERFIKTDAKYAVLGYENCVAVIRFIQDIDGQIAKQEIDVNIVEKKD